MSDIRESARQLAEGVSATLPDEKRESVQKTAAVIAADLRTTCTGDPDMIAVELAQSITRMLATLSATPAGAIGEMMDHNMCAYAMAAGALAGVYALPETGDSQDDTLENVPAWEQSSNWPGTGQYL